ncbi:hypothetical protein L195_g009435 [Trifolium pratense]|uniref:Auxilin-like protein n=1 Tax=Trifolium pratense TaxID=57577 RepID=A0A2K3PBX7_TRIPR|nr:hypothetical protein L195_g009435 [Trifolium pratense]
MKVDFDTTARQKTIFGCLKALHAQNFVLAISIDRLGQHMSLVDYRTTLRYRLMIPFSLLIEVGGKHACVDLTEVSPLMGLGNRDFTVGQAALKVASSKVAKPMRKRVLTINTFLSHLHSTLLNS